MLRDMFMNVALSILAFQGGQDNITNGFEIDAGETEVVESLNQEEYFMGEHAEEVESIIMNNMEEFAEGYQFDQYTTNAEMIAVMGEDVWVEMKIQEAEKLYALHQDTLNEAVAESNARLDKSFEEKRGLIDSGNATFPTLSIVGYGADNGDNNVVAVLEEDGYRAMFSENELCTMLNSLKNRTDPNLRELYADTFSQYETVLSTATANMTSLSIDELPEIMDVDSFVVENSDMQPFDGSSTVCDITPKVS